MNEIDMSIVNYDKNFYLFHIDMNINELRFTHMSVIEFCINKLNE